MSGQKWELAEHGARHKSTLGKVKPGEACHRWERDQQNVRRDTILWPMTMSQLWRMRARQSRVKKTPENRQRKRKSWQMAVRTKEQ